MISSMTGYGRGEVSALRMTATAEVRTVNSRFLEITARLPHSLTLRENDLKELVRASFVRGKVNVVATIVHENESDAPLKINAAAAKAYYRLLVDLRKAVKLRERVTLDHLLKFPEVLEVDDLERADEKEWNLVQQALSIALHEAAEMRRREGGELLNDLRQRVTGLEEAIGRIERIAAGRIPLQRARLAERLKELLTDQSVIDSHRLEFEIALFADKLDVTEECVRFRSHVKFFLDGLEGSDAAGRKCNFLVQEMNREVNTIGSKANDAEIAHLVVAVKEEIEKIREQLQNIE